MTKLDPKAPAMQDYDDDRPGVQEVTRDMIFDYVYSVDGDCELPRRESASAFADWADTVWFEFAEEEGTTNEDVIEGMLEDWRGGSLI